MDDQHTRIASTLRPVMDAAVGLAREFESAEEALRALRQVEVAVSLATDLLMHDHLVAARAE
jgi:hypothetical protein